MSKGSNELSLGAIRRGDRTDFRAYAPGADVVTIELLKGGSGATPEPIEMTAAGGGYFSASLDDVPAGTMYRFRLGDASLPDPASRWQPEGVHGPSAVVDPGDFRWRHRIPETPRAGASIYELHVGTFTPEGTFRAAAQRLEHVRDLGVTHVELMPLGEFPGGRNWGYDPGLPFAPASAYGTPDDLRFLVDTAHGLGLGVLLDVVYNHFGPDGAYLPAFVPGVLTDRHETPWGKSLDFDGPVSEFLRRYFIENALMWLREYRFDGLRLDATFAIVDESRDHFLAELSRTVDEVTGGSAWLIAEDPRNLRNVILPRERGGLGLGGVWADDLHHQIRVRLAGDDRGYFSDFRGTSEEIAATLKGNWFYSGHHSRHQGRPRGTPAHDLPPELFVVCIQNHDQVGNRARGERLHHEVESSAWRAATSLLLFLPQTPLLFMGQEWASSSPFQYFTDHQGELGRLVSEGRKEEFRDFDFAGEVPDPQDLETFKRSRLDWTELEREPGAGTLALYRHLLRLRRSLTEGLEVLAVAEGGLAVRRGRHSLLVAFEGGTALPAPAECDVVFSSESEEYASDSHPPVFGDGHWHFKRPGALVIAIPEGSPDGGTGRGPRGS